MLSSAADALWRDVVVSLRLLRRAPGFALVTIATLALAIGANAVVFGVLNGLILRPIDVPDPGSLYGIEHANEHSMYESYPDYLDLRDRNRSFVDLAGYTIVEAGLDNGENPTRSWAVEATGNYFDALGIQPHLGRVFHASDERGPGSAPYVVLGYSYWHTQLHDDPGVVGRSVRVNQHAFTIIGVAPPDFHGTITFFNPDFYVPIVNQAQIEGRSRLDLRTSQSLFQTLGHLRPGVTPPQAAADLDSVGAYLEQTYPTDHGTTTFTLARPGLYGNYLGQPLRAFVAGLMLLAGLILLAACANLGSLFAARAADRSRDIALRLALGASRIRILRQLLVEAGVIALAGGAVGLWGSIVLLRALTTWHPIPKFPLNVPVSPDASVYLVALALAVLSALVFGLVPARQVLRTGPYQVIKSGPGGSAGRRITLRDGLLVAQIAICAVLVTASLVAVRGLTRSLQTSFGFDPAHALLADTDLSMVGYTVDTAPVMQKRMIEAVEAIPGVESVGLVGRPPLAEGGFGSAIFTDATTDLRPSNAVVTAFRYQMSPEYLRAARTALVAGRTFTWHDDKGAPPVALVNRALAIKLFGSVAGAPGGHFKLRDGSRLEVVGVVEDGKYSNLTEDPASALFVPILQMPMTETWLVVRSAGPEEPLAAPLRSVLRRLDAGLPIYVQTWEKQLDFALFPARMATMALGVMGGMGALLAVTGIFGMAAYSVSKRLKEFGIRIALGARPAHVLGAALGRAVTLLLIGSTVGLMLGLLASRVLAAIVYQATPRDPAVLGGVAALMLALGVLATWIPAQRSLSVDPLKLLREE